MTVYRLGEQESYVCGDCEYVGIDVEHGAEPEEVESWDEAMARFRTRFGDSKDADGVNVDVEVGEDVDDGEASGADDSKDGRQDIDSLGTGGTDTDGTDADDDTDDDDGDADDRDDLDPAVVRVGGDGDADA